MLGSSVPLELSQSLKCLEMAAHWHLHQLGNAQVENESSLPRILLRILFHVGRSLVLPRSIKHQCLALGRKGRTGRPLPFIGNCPSCRSALALCLHCLLSPHLHCLLLPWSAAATRPLKSIGSPGSSLSHYRLL